MPLEKEKSLGSFSDSEKANLEVNLEVILEVLVKNNAAEKEKSQDRETSIDDFKKSTCGANKKDRRRCQVVVASYESCHKCPFVNPDVTNVNLGKDYLRGGIETSADSAAWRKNKLINGIPHGDD